MLILEKSMELILTNLTVMICINFIKVLCDFWCIRLSFAQTNLTIAIGIDFLEPIATITPWTAIISAMMMLMTKETTP